MRTGAREVADLSQRLTAKKVSGYVYIPETLPFAPGAQNSQSVVEVSGAAHLHNSCDMDGECGHVSGMQRRQVRKHKTEV